MTNCEFCGEPASKDDPSVYFQVAEWVTGAKRHGAVLREYTDKIAHEECIKKAAMGQAPDQEPLF